MNKIFLWTALCLFSLTSYAQKMHIIKIRTGVEDRVKIPNRLFYIHHVVDARQDTNSVGVIQKGMVNQQYQANLEYGATKYFEKTFGLGQLDINLDEKLKAVTMVITELQISEWSAFASEIGSLEMNLDFFEMEGDSIKKKIFTAEIIEENRGMNITVGHPERVKRAITRALTALNSFLQNPKDNSTVYSESEKQLEKVLEKGALTVLTYPAALTSEDDIHHCKQKRAGLYRNLEELRTNRPSLTGDYVIEELSSGRIRLRTATNNTTLKGPFFGYCDGKDVYISARTYQSAWYFAKVTTFGTVWAWEDNFMDSNDRAMYLLFRMQGYLDNQTVRGFDCVTLNWNTGRVRHALPSSIEAIIDDAELLAKYKMIPHNNRGTVLTELVQVYNFKHPLK